jgi:hypothetical protein
MKFALLTDLFRYRFPACRLPAVSTIPVNSENTRRINFPGFQFYLMVLDDILLFIDSDAQ